MLYLFISFGCFSFMYFVYAFGRIIECNYIRFFWNLKMHSDEFVIKIIKICFYILTENCDCKVLAENMVLCFDRKVFCGFGGKCVFCDFGGKIFLRFCKKCVLRFFSKSSFCGKVCVLTILAEKCDFGCKIRLYRFNRKIRFYSFCENVFLRENDFFFGFGGNMHFAAEKRFFDVAGYFLAAFVENAFLQFWRENSFLLFDGKICFNGLTWKMCYYHFGGVVAVLMRKWFLPFWRKIDF